MAVMVHKWPQPHIELRVLRVSPAMASDRETSIGSNECSTCESPIHTSDWESITSSEHALVDIEGKGRRKGKGKGKGTGARGRGRARGKGKGRGRSNGRARGNGRGKAKGRGTSGAFFAVAASDFLRALVDNLDDLDELDTQMGLLSL